MTWLFKRIALWMAMRYLSEELGLYAYIISRPWYPIVTLHAKRAEQTRSRGEHKRVFVENSVKEYLVKTKQELPKDRDLQLAIELAVREIR